MKKPTIENLEALVRGMDLNIYQKADAINEFFRLKAYVEELESLTIIPLCSCPFGSHVSSKDFSKCITCGGRPK